MEYKPFYHLKLEIDIATGTVALKTGFTHLLLHFFNVSLLEQLGTLILGILTEALLHDNTIPNHSTYNVVEVIAILSTVGKLVVNNYVAVSINNYHQLHTKQFCMELTKAFLSETFCNKLLIDIAM